MAPNRRPTGTPLDKLGAGIAPTPLGSRREIVERKTKNEKRLPLLLLLLLPLPSCPPPALPQPEPGFAAATPPAACDALGDPDERAVCETRRVEIDALAELAVDAPDPEHRIAGLAALGREPCFPLASACDPLAPRLLDEPDPRARSLVGPALTCRCGPAAYALLADAIRSASDPQQRLNLIRAATDAVVSGRAGQTSEDDLRTLADALVALVDDQSEDPDVRHAAAGAIPLLGIGEATDRLMQHPDDPDAAVRLRDDIASGDGAALVPDLLEQFRSTDPAERLKAVQALTFLAVQVGDAQAAILEVALLGGEDPSPDVREAAGRLDPTMFLEGQRDVLAHVVAAHLAQGRLIDDAPGELAALPVESLVPSRVRRHVLAAAAVLAAVVAGPAGDLGSMPDDDAGPLAALEPLLASDDPELRLVALVAARRGLEQAATVRRPSDPNPVVDAVERGQGDRLRVTLTLAGRTVSPGDWESLLPSSAREAFERPLDRSLLDAFERVSAWRIAGGDSTSERARLTALYDRIFLRGFDDADQAFDDAQALAAAAAVSDLALSAERRAEVVYSCLAALGTDRNGAFPRSLAELQAFNRAAAGTACQDNDLILATDDLRAACAKVEGEAGEVVGERCR